MTGAHPSHRLCPAYLPSESGAAVRYSVLRAASNIIASAFSVPPLDNDGVGHRQSPLFSASSLRRLPLEGIPVLMSSLKRTRSSDLAEEWIENPRPNKHIAACSRWSSPSDHHLAGDPDTHVFPWGDFDAYNVPPLVSDESTATYALWGHNVNDERNDPPQWTIAQTSPLPHDGIWDRGKILKEFDGYEGGQYKVADPLFKEQFWLESGASQCSALPAAPLSTPEALESATNSDYSTPKAACVREECPPPGELCFGMVRTSDISLLLTF